MSYKIIIADDEQKIIELIQALGHWEALNIEIAALCSSGEETLSCILELRPDIVLTDIQMPDMDGLEMIRRTKQAGLRTRFIVVSGYRHFDYARDAISLGVVDYLLKPLDEGQLNDTLQKTCRQIDEERRQQKDQISLSRYEEQDRENAIEKFWEFLLSEDAAKEKFPKTVQACNQQYRTEFGEDSFKCVYLTTNIDGLLSGKGSLFEEKVLDALDDIFARHLVYYTHLTAKGIFLVLNFDSSSQSLVRQLLSSVYYSIKNLTEIYGDFILNIGVSRTKEEIFQLPEACQEAIIAEWGRLVFLGDNVLEYDSIADLPHFGIRDLLPTKEEMNLCNSVRYLMLDQVGAAFEKIAKNAVRYKDFYPGDMRSFVNHLFRSLFVIHIEGDEDKYEELDRSFEFSVKSAKNFPQVIHSFYLFLEQYLTEVSEKMQEKKQKPIEEAKQLIDEHFEEELSLEAVAEAVSLSPAYFSRIFKAEMEVGFSEYLVSVRIEKAKDFLMNTNNSVKEIAREVGYTDEKYFSKLFKKQVGIKPTEFRKLYRH